MTTGTIDIADIQSLTAVCHDFVLSFCANICATTDITSGITTTINIIDVTTKKLGLCLTSTILL